MEPRIERNIPTLTPEEEALLGQKHILLAGCGGLGGYLLELLVRAGVGELSVVDPDRFTPGNLNRQALCTAATLGQSKALAARARALEIAPTVRVHAYETALDARSAPELLRSCDLALDALDNVPSRLALADACAAAGIPLVHGAVAGLRAQAAVIPPGSGLLRRIYAGAAEPAEKSVLAPACALCAAVQAAEAVKLLAGRPASLAGRLLWIDLEEMEFQTAEF